MLRLFHKYLSLVISIQLLLWTVSGVFFAFNKIELIRGEQYLVEVKSSELNLDNVEVAFAAKNISFLQRLDEWIIKVEDESVSHYTDLEGKKLKELNAEEAKVVVTRNTNLTPLEAIRIERAGPGAEFRGRNLPIYKVSTLTDNDVNVYVDVFSGEITAIRSDSWRAWDFLWGAHIIDYSERDDFNNFWLKIFSILAVISALSGIALFFKTYRR